jgi:PHP-associated
LHLPETGSSDAHHLRGVGSAFTAFTGSTAEEFRRCLHAGSTRAGGNFVWHREMTGVMKARTAYRWKKYVASRLTSQVSNPTETGDPRPETQRATAR